MRAARFTIITPECIRLEYSESGRFVDEPSVFAAVRGGAGDPAIRVVAQGDGEQVIDTGRIRLEYAPDGRAFHAANLRAVIREGDFEARWWPGESQQRNLGGAMRSLDGVRGPVSLPEGLLSRDGWFLLDDSRSPLIVDGWAAPRPVGAGVDWFLFGYGRNYAGALRALGAVAGRVPMPRKCMLGSWYSRYWAYTSEEIREVVRGYDEHLDHPFPLDVMVLDMDWHRGPPEGSGLPGWTGWSWNRELLPDAEGLLKWLHDSGLAVTLNLHPADGVRWYEDAYGAFMRRLGRDPGTRETDPFDAGDRRYMEALLAEVHAPLEQAGVDFWWMDWQQEEWTGSVARLSNALWLNEVYFGWTTRATSGQRTVDSGQQESAVRGASFGRWGGWGDHRHGVHFSGDVHSGWRALAFVVDFTIRSGNSGCFFWSHDIGGHFGARDEEAMTRWTQFGALSAAMRVHSARSARLDRRPFLCERPYAEAMRKAYDLRSRLMPTIYSAARACHEQMRPLLRGMHVDWARDERAYACPGQYMLGDLLVAPVVSAGIGERKVGTVVVWFPGGEEVGRHQGNAASRHRGGEAWCRFATGERYGAGTEAIVAAAIDEIPVFVRAGVPVVMQQWSTRMGTEPMREMTVRCYPGTAGRQERASVYEDDGATTAYLRGEYARSEVTAAWNGARRVRIEILPAAGAFAGQVERRSYAIELGAVSAVRGVRLDGKRTEVVEYSAAHRLATVRVPERSIRERVVVEMEFDEADAAAIAREHRDRRLAGARGGEAPADRLLAISSGIGVRVEDGSYRLHDSHGLIDGGDTEVEVVDRIGARESKVWSGRIRVEPGLAEWIGDPAPGLAQPPLGLRASRLVRVSFRSGRRPESFETLVRTRLVPLSAWRVVGPFAFDHMRTIDEQKHGPEIGPADGAAAYAGAGGSEVRWQRGEGSDKWAVDLRRHYSGGSIMAYAVTHVWSGRAQRAMLELESGDRMEAWVNEEKVFSMDTGDMMDAASGTAQFALGAGWNRIAVKVSEGGGGFGFTAAIDGEEATREAVEPE